MLQWINLKYWKMSSISIRRSRCCHLHRHSANIYHDCWCNHPDHYRYVHIKVKCAKRKQLIWVFIWFLHFYVWEAFNKIGGYGNLERVYSIAIPKKIIPNSTCHLPRADAMHLFRDAVTGDLPWPGMTLGLTILATWYWCTDQVHLDWQNRQKSVTKWSDVCDTVAC